MPCSRWFSCPWGVARSALGGTGDLQWAPWALMGPALLDLSGPSRAGTLKAPLGTHGPGTCVPPWGFVGRALVGSLGPCGPGTSRPPLALAGQALAGLLGPCGLPWALVGPALVGHLGPHGPGPDGPPGPLTQHSAKYPGNLPLLISFRSYQ